MASRCGDDDVALYAIDALDDPERIEFELHLAGCGRCRTSLIALSPVVTALAVALEPLQPPSALRARILVAVRARR